MGIPVYFKNITDQYPHIIIKKQEKLETQKTTHLFFDFNGLIHPCVHNVLNKLQETQKTKNKKIIISSEKLEEMFLVAIKKYLFYILTEIKPTKLVYISIDGVAPRAKMVQQRKRRYRSVKQKQTIREIRKSFNLPESIEWDTNAITPGTKFMEKLSKYLHAIDFQKEFSETCEVILSDASHPGEGEHKILQYLKQNFKVDEQNDENDENQYLIYGLDADLIMLSMASKIDNIYLLRESVHFGKIDQDQLLLLDIDKLKQYLYETMIHKIGIPQITKTMILQDYICLCFLIGNDFIPNLPGLTIKNGGIDLLISVYISLVIKRKECLVFNGELNIGFLKDLLIQLLKQENDLVTKQRLQYEKKRFFNKNNSNGAYETELSKLKFMPLLKPKTTVYKIMAGTENWRKRYYYQLFNIKIYNNQVNQNILEICQNYLEGILWTTKYYFEECCCWDWHYMYLHAPTLKELVDNFEICFDKIDFEQNSQKTPVIPLIQLLNVYPPQSAHLLPDNYGELMTNKDSPIYHYYPTKVSLDRYLHTYYHQCEPKLPNIDIDLIYNTLKCK